MGSLNVCSGESSTRTLFMRVMETFDDDDDDDYTILYYTILYYTILYYTILYFRETFDIEILLSQIIIICCACSVDRAFGILFRKNCTIYRFYHILYFYTYFIVQIFLRSSIICSRRRDIIVYTLNDQDIFYT